LPECVVNLRCALIIIVPHHITLRLCTDHCVFVYYITFIAGNELARCPATEALSLNLH